MAAANLNVNEGLLRELASTVGAGNFPPRERLVPAKIKEPGERVECVSAAGKIAGSSAQNRTALSGQNPPDD